MVERYEVGVAGCGSIATERHIPAVQSNQRTKLQAVYDHKWPNAEATAERFDIPGIYDNYEAFLAADFDVLIVATPPFTHAELSIAGLQADKHVLCEKPMAVTLSDAQEMSDVADKTGQTLGVVHNFLYSRSIQKAKERIRTGQLGSVQYVKGFQLSSPRRDLPSWYTELPGGLFFDESPHLLYLMEYFLGELELNTVTAQHDPDAAQSLSSVTASFYGHADKVGQLTMLFDAPLSEWLLVVVGSRRVLVIDIFRDIFVELDREESHSPTEVLKVALSAISQISTGVVSSGIRVLRGDLYFGFNTLLSDYLAALDRSGEPPVTGADGYRLLTKIHEVVDAATTDSR